MLILHPHRLFGLAFFLLFFSLQSTRLILLFYSKNTLYSLSYPFPWFAHVCSLPSAIHIYLVYKHLISPVLNPRTYHFSLFISRFFSISLKLVVFQLIPLPMTFAAYTEASNDRLPRLKRIIKPRRVMIFRGAQWILNKQIFCFRSPEKNATHTHTTKSYIQPNSY
ncbi:uncharacterized protein BDW43DRAFT_266234 [Aspergillus alliaceus]|uniref:uncharacterized protein n=1 Tax=Petromyces alliaceus TaxID=209559 RepID=UPI0012A65192|nr:uncharacterized protein BDW43DRAFT_266234 [Aspergillus alliaceus]KAB8236845.1 hypothetical protein BDW43DRAFT_266234 [Aspergillus alliaceus]